MHRTMVHGFIAMGGITVTCFVGLAGLNLFSRCPPPSLPWRTMTEQTQIEALASTESPTASTEPAVAGPPAASSRTASGSAASTRCASASCGASATASPGCGSRSATPPAPPRRSAGRRPRRSTRSAAPAPPVFVSGVFEISERWGAKIKIAALREAEPHEYETEDLAAESEVSAEQLEGDLRELLATVQNPQLRELLDRFFGEDSRDLAALPRRAGGEDLPPGLPPRAARAHALGRPGGLRRRQLLPRHRPRRRRHRRPPARHRQVRRLQRRPAGDRPHRRRPPPGRDPARLLHRAPGDRGPAGLRPRASPSASSTSSSATTARSSTAPRSSPPPARPSSST